ncbi:MAG TPA: phosphopantetheine-binding protein [Micromonosporaceae bacterium]|jgi:acyl carrier protein|nr:phosphopantetheine-binding protein [Micromonosporaceae bacterium]
MANFPSLDEVLRVLGDIIDRPVTGDVALADLSVDSLDLLEWSFTLEDKFKLALGDELIAAVDYGKPLGEVYDAMLAVAERAQAHA